MTGSSFGSFSMHVYIFVYARKGQKAMVSGRQVGCSIFDMNVGNEVSHGVVQMTIGRTTQNQHYIPHAYIRCFQMYACGT